jgi:hypothetical protein
MTNSPAPRFDPKALESLAGAKSFARGQEYLRAGAVQILAIEQDRVLAQVAGSDDYRTVLTGSGKRIRGECSCPAFGDYGFCKHLVAVGLAANPPPADDPGVLSRIRQHLCTKSADALAAIILALAERDPALLHRLELEATSTHGDDGAVAGRLRKAIDAATHVPQYLDYREAGSWAEQVDAALQAVAGLVTTGRPGLALDLTELAVRRVEGVVEDIDGSDGHCSALLGRACEIHLQAAQQAAPDPVAFARRLLALETRSDWGTFADAATHYADVLGPAGLAEYRRLATQAWEQDCRGDEPDAPPRHSVRRILDSFLEQDGDLDGRIALRVADLSTPESYEALVAFCRKHGRLAEAVRWAEEGYFVHETARLAQHAGELLEPDRPGDAETYFWRAFESRPTLELFTRLRKIGGDPARTRALAIVENELSSGRAWAGSALLIEILIQEGMFDAAWDVVRRHQLDVHLHEKVARATERTHPRDALAFYGERVMQLAGAGGNQAYHAAAALIGRMAPLHDPAEHASFLADLKARHHRKRNLLALLP